jgi:hypothetical protein
VGEGRTAKVGTGPPGARPDAADPRRGDDCGNSDNLA